MALAAITAKQVAILFILIFAGYLCVRLGVFQDHAKQVLSNLLLYVVSPCMVLNSYFAEYDPNTAANILKMLVLSTVLMASGIVTAWLLRGRFPKGQENILWFCCSFPNAGYMGFPLIIALYGQEGLLYASMYVTMFNVLMWTIGYTVLNGKMEVRELTHTLLTTPTLWAVTLGLIIYFARIPVADIIQSPIASIGDMNTPIAMMIVGIIMAGAHLGKAFTNRTVLSVVFIRMILCPVIALAIAVLLGTSGMVPQVAVVLQACPCAAVCAVFAVRFHYDEELTAGCVVLSTLFSILTLPPIALLLSSLVG